MNKFKNKYIKVDSSEISTANASTFYSRIKFMELMENNHSIGILKNTESIEQLIAPLTDFKQNVELFYELISAKTGIPLVILLGTSAKGLNATGEGDRRDFYDLIKEIQTSCKSNTLIAMGILAGIEDGKFVEFEDYDFAKLEESTEKEEIENLVSITTIVKDMLDMGIAADKALEWYKSKKGFGLEILEFDLNAGDDPTDDTDFISAFNADFKEMDHPRAGDGKFSSKKNQKEHKDSDHVIDNPSKDKKIIEIKGDELDNTSNIQE